MKTTLYWKKGIFSQTTRIYLQNKCIGTLTGKTWCESATGEINREKYAFRTRGWFRNITMIIDVEKNAEIGHIVYNSWMTKAKVICLNEKAEWRYINLWNTRWSITGTDGNQIEFHGHSNSGDISFINQDNFLILTGLYIANYYWQLTFVVLIIILIPLFLAGS